MVARVGPHSDVADLAKHSAVPVINALSDDFHPLQTIADFLTLYETYVPGSSGTVPADGLSLDGLKLAWVGDSNNVLFDLAIGCVKMGVDISVASPSGYGIPYHMKTLIDSSAKGVSKPGKLLETTSPAEAIKNADVLVTDTWVSMGQEAESQKRLRAFEGFQITEDMARNGGAKADWRFMHCLPRHKEEVDDDVFYGERSLVFPEAENRLWAAVGMFFLLIPPFLQDLCSIRFTELFYSGLESVCGQGMVQGMSTLGARTAGLLYGVEVELVHIGLSLVLKPEPQLPRRRGSSLRHIHADMLPPDFGLLGGL